MNRPPANQARSLLFPQPALARRPTPRVAVSGGKGGVGKTLIAVNTALLLAQSGRRVLLVDLDPGLGDIHVHLRIAPQRSLEDAVEGRCTAAAACLEVRPALHLLTGRSGSDALANGDRDYLARALATVDEAGEDFDLVICDTGAGIGPAVLETARSSQLVLAVTTPDPASVTDAYALLKIFDREGIAEPELVVNRIRRREDAMRTTARLGEVCRRFLGHGVESIGWLTDDAAFERSIQAQRPFAETGRGAAMEDLRALAAAIAARVPAKRGAARDQQPSDAAEAMRRLTAR